MSQCERPYVFFPWTAQQCATLHGYFYMVWQRYGRQGRFLDTYEMLELMRAMAYNPKVEDEYIGDGG